MLQGTKLLQPSAHLQDVPLQVFRFIGAGHRVLRKRQENVTKGFFFGWTRWNKDFFHREEQGFVFAPFPSLSCFLVVFCLTECWTKTDFEKLIAGPVMKKKALDVVVVVDDDDEL